ncbi:sodium:solute symporter family protein [Marinilabilia rubra]|uniref:Sodium:solute symporter n=1 Tax=Marinilabilia rubra TaxID=2162893 RepID=A0A2U2B4V9_9BACT|nr:sodium:solute symporter family protein [Marinilabilia rubra]PWD98099.1 sodium:solute symporter [Marinilabilia rubra]
MHIADFIIIFVYIIAMLMVGLWFHRKNQSSEDYYVGGRKMTRWHLGLSVVATDVGGGFSIGLGGLGFAMGLSGSWILFTGLIGAWLTAVVLIPRVYKIAFTEKFQTFPEMLSHHYGKKVAFWAGIISAVGYLGFTSSQILAGAKLTSGTIDGLSVNNAALIMGIIAIVYTALGGIKAVIYTDTVQWAILLSGLTFVGVPFALHSVGGLDVLRASVDKEMLQLTNIQGSVVVNWAFSIIPIWFIGMTLYQRIYAASSKKEAQKAWFLAGLFEYPVMAFLGVFLGLMAKVSIDQGVIPAADAAGIDNETAMPMMLKFILPTGALGIILAAYFSAILSTADSCLMASSGNFVRDIFKVKNTKSSLKVSQIMTFILGGIALVLALFMPSVLDLMLLSYSFMVSGLLAPVVGFIFFKQPKPMAGLLSMASGAAIFGFFHFSGIDLPYQYAPVVPGVLASLIVLFIVQKMGKAQVRE